MKSIHHHAWHVSQLYIMFFVVLCHIDIIITQHDKLFHVLQGVRESYTKVVRASFLYACTNVIHSQCSSDYYNLLSVVPVLLLLMCQKN
jgi:hypothetical protein